ncbi:uncharacterized protein LOC126987271 [Eriocheir sinensis]|uniref:uncharacterized protein LOC126987271 n=1 Tax=Eriocheir sinensis TaxID=95602 RepID=UPI0021C98ADC|nr:uncharacterized protein LOC126987271 [Eriocheir sinensis]
MPFPQEDANRMGWKRPRKPNFTEAEVLAMVTAIRERYDHLYGRSARYSTKAAAWSQVTEEVNAVGRAQRDIGEIRTKFKHYKSDVKKKRAKDLQYQKETGGGQSQRLVYSEAEETTLSLLPKTATIGTPGAPCGLPGPCGTRLDQVALTREHNQDVPVAEEEEEEEEVMAVKDEEEVIVKEEEEVMALKEEEVMALKKEEVMAVEEEEEEEEEEWRQAHPRIIEVANGLAEALEDHSYMASQGTPSQPSRPSPSHPYARPASLTPTHQRQPGLHRRSIRGASTSHRTRDLELLNQMFEVHKSLANSVERLNTTLEEGFAQVTQAAGEIATAIRYAADKVS